MRGQVAAQVAVAMVGLPTTVGREPLDLAALRDAKDALLRRFPGANSGGCSAVEWNAWASAVLALRPNTDPAVWSDLAAVTISKRRSAFCNLVGFRFPGQTHFTAIAFAQGADFSSSHFHGPVSFRPPEASEVAEEEAAVNHTVFSKKIAFDGAQFDSAADFTDVLFSPSIGFARAVFRGPALFERAEFRRAARFHDARFEAAVSFDGASFAADGQGDATGFTGTQFCAGGTGEAALTNVTFYGAKSGRAPVTFDGCVFHTSADFEGTRFGTKAEGVVRHIDLSFTGAQFLRQATFGGIHAVGDWVFPAQLQFDRGADFSRAQFDANVDFSNAGLSIPASYILSFHAAQIGGDLAFGRERHIPCRLSLDDARISGRVAGTAVVFGEDARTGKEPHSFARTEFHGDVALTHCRFFGGLACDRAQFKGQLDLSDTAVHGLSRFADAGFASAALFNRTEFNEPAAFRGTSFARLATFERATFGQPGGAKVMNAGEVPVADFEGALFEDFARFDGATFNGALHLHRIAKGIAVTLGGTRFASGVPKLTQVEFRFSPELDQVKWGREDTDIDGLVTEAIDRKSIEPRELASRLRALRRIAETERDLGLAQKLAVLALNADPDRRAGARLFNWVRRLLIGDGEKVMRPVILLLVATLLVFPGIYVANHLPPLQISSVEDARKTAATFLAASCGKDADHPFVSALHASARSALFAIPDIEERAKQVTTCLYGEDGMKVLSNRWHGLIPILQSLLSAILLFAIGSAVRNRLRVR